MREIEGEEERIKERERVNNFVVGLRGKET